MARSTRHLPTDVVSQPLAVTVWVSTEPDNPRRGIHTLGVRIGDRKHPDLTDEEQQYVAWALEVAAEKVAGERDWEPSGEPWPPEGHAVA